MKSLIFFLVAGLCEIGGGYLVWLWAREGKGRGYALVGAVFLIMYGVVPTLQTENFGCVYAAYGESSWCFRFYGDGRLTGSCQTDSTS